MFPPRTIIPLWSNSSGSRGIDWPEFVSLVQQATPPGTPQSFETLTDSGIVNPQASDIIVYNGALWVNVPFVPPVPAEYENFLADPNATNLSYTGFSDSTNILIGPTGSGATITWAALDALMPYTYLRLNAYFEGTANAGPLNTSGYVVIAPGTTTTPFQAAYNRLQLGAYAAGTTIIRSANAFIEADATGRFYFRWASTGFAAVGAGVLSVVSYQRS